MIKTYIKLQFDSNGARPSEVIHILKGIGCSPIIGDFDFEKSLKQGESLFEALDSIHLALKGTGVQYSVTTRTIPDAESERKSKEKTASKRNDGNKTDDKILDSIEPGGSTALSLSKKLSLSRDEIDLALGHLLKEGTVTRKKKGRYHIYLKK